MAKFTRLASEPSSASAQGQAPSDAALAEDAIQRLNDGPCCPSCGATSYRVPEKGKRAYVSGTYVLACDVCGQHYTWRGSMSEQPW